VAVTNAFLLPPSVSSHDNELVKALPFELAPFTQLSTVRLPCKTCPVAVPNKGARYTWIDGVDNYLSLEFSVVPQDGSGADALFLNGVQIYPPRFDQLPEPLTALQVAAGTDPSEAANQNLRLGYELAFRPEQKSNADHLEFIAMHFQIVEIADKFIDGLEDLKVKLIKTPAGKIMIANVELTATTNPPTDPRKNLEDCKTLICRFRAIVAGKLSYKKAMKGDCGSKKSNYSVPTHHKHHSGHRHHHHGHHNGFGRLMHAARSIAIHVLIPIFIGVAVGLTASIIGMIAGQIIVFFWRAIYRNGQGNYVRVEEEDEKEEEDEGEESVNEKVAFLEAQAPTPVYEDTETTAQ